MKMIDALSALRAGTLSFRAFVEQTKPIWRSQALYFLRRYPCEPRVELEDLVQVILMNVWVFVGRYDPNNPQGVKLDEYVFYNAGDKAKKLLKKERETHRPTGQARYQLAEDTEVSTIAIPAVQERIAHASVVFDRAEGLATSTRELIALQCLRLSGGCVERAAELLYEDPGKRLACRLGSEDGARRLIRGSLRLIKDAAA